MHEKSQLRPALTAAAVLLALMAALMLHASWEDSATVDETTVLGAGFTYWKGYRFYFVPEHPPLSQMLIAAPLLGMDLNISPEAQLLLRGEAGYPWTVGWFGPIRPLQQVFPEGRHNWYFFALPESQLFGQMFVYGSGNNGDAMLFRARLVQILFTVATGVLIFLWAMRVTGQPWAAVAALAMWTFNPNALAYGHLATTGDINVTFGITAALFCFALLLQSPTPLIALLCGLLTGVALLMKFTALTLGPIYIVLAAALRKWLPPWKQTLKLAVLTIASTWLVLIVVYAPLWQPAPPISTAQADALHVPHWFRTLRPILIPRDFFKGVALALNHSKGGHDAFLWGEWSKQGWWYYYPVAFVLKSPLAFLALLLGGTLVFCRRFRNAPPLETVPWLAALVYLGLAMTSKVNIGVRHLLPMIPLLCIGVPTEWFQFTRPSLHRVAVFLLAWQAIVTVVAHPYYVHFFSEAVGGSRNGYRYLLDSNFDWGQDARRLKRCLDHHGIKHIYLDYFGTQFSIEHLEIPNTRVTAEEARKIQKGWLVISASRLMRPEWEWLRNARPAPDMRVAYTLFLFQMSKEMHNSGSDHGSFSD